MKKHFITGLVILLPLAVTLALVLFIVNFVTQPFMGFFEHVFDNFNWYPKYQTIVQFLLKILLLFCLIFFTILLGFLARLLVFKSLLKLYNYIMHRIPFIKTVYKATQQIIKTLFGTSSRSFKQVVMVPFPIKGAYAIGLISSPAPTICEKTLNMPLVSVYVPTTPNPTSGFLMVYKEEDVIYVDMKIEDALKYVISCGVITSNEPTSPTEDDEIL